MVINLIKLEKNRKQEYKILYKKSYSEIFFFSILFVDPEGQSDALGWGYTATTSLILVVLLVSADQHGYMGVVKDVVTNAAQEGAADLAHSTCSCDNQLGVLVLRHLADDFAWATADALNFSSDLHKKINKPSEKVKTGECSENENVWI